MHLFNKTMLDRIADKRGARAHAHLPEDMGAVRIHGVNADGKVSSNFLNRPAAADQQQNLQFAGT